MLEPMSGLFPWPVMGVQAHPAVLVCIVEAVYLAHSLESQPLPNQLLQKATEGVLFVEHFFYLEG